MTGDVIRAWVSENFPESTRGKAGWVADLRAEGFTIDGRPAPRPTTAWELYRGAAWHRSHGLSWTTSRATALRFASKDGQIRARGRLYVATVEPERMLAIWHERHEREVVVDTDGLVVREWTAEEFQEAPEAQRRPPTHSNWIGFG